MNELNYAKTYADALAQAFPYTLHFGALYATPNNGRFRFRGGKTIEIPIITTSGRVDADRDTVGDTSRNYENAWERQEKEKRKRKCTKSYGQYR